MGPIFDVATVQRERLLRVIARQHKELHLQRGRPGAQEATIGGSQAKVAAPEAVITEQRVTIT